MNLTSSLAADGGLPGAMWVGSQQGLSLFAPTLPGSPSGACYATTASVPGYGC